MITDFVSWLSLPTWPWRDITMIAFALAGAFLVLVAATNERRRCAFLYAGLAFFFAFALKP